MEQDLIIWCNQILQNPQNILPLKSEISQDVIVGTFGNLDVVSTTKNDGEPLTLKYHDIKLYFDRKVLHGFYLIYSDDEIELSIIDHREGPLQPVTSTEPVDNESSPQDEAVYFSSPYENSLLNDVAPRDFCYWHHQGKSSAVCFLGGIRLCGADPVSLQALNYVHAMDRTVVYAANERIPGADLADFQVLDNGQSDSGASQGYTKDSQQVYSYSGDGKVKIIKSMEVSSFLLLDDTYFAKGGKWIYAYGEQLPKADLLSWELLSRWYSRDVKRVYYLNREIRGADRDDSTVCAPLDASSLADHLARDEDHFYQNDEMTEESL